ncbi:arsenic transporter [Mucilaginibacter sp. SP1R1]|uniref:arsenic transporter n=1 Tax=Mucilaginibacter sp. SP1R1 TaxID=2723091 RepID=UPI00160DE438|nr:arsenic transporter [Mucilaginibacter sp. SP1R1]MBB6148531.1 arsenical pump membrane protein [Mucilaginibacter sp. SP1R1]
MNNHLAVYLIAFLSIAGVIIRPFKITEYIWAVSGALLLLICGLILPVDAFSGLSKGNDVYLFLTGMMLLAETAREEKLFDWLAAHATNLAKGFPYRLFMLIYLVGVIVTALLSNDATAVVLTPAVAAAAKAANVKKPLPYLLICAFVANAASFVLPISNPANLVIYGKYMPSLLRWLAQYMWPSLVSIIVTYLLLLLTQRSALKQTIENKIEVPTLSLGGKTALLGIIATAVILLVASAFNMQLGLPTAVAGIITSAVVILNARKNPWSVIKGVSWSVLPLVGGLFIIVEALKNTGLINYLSAMLQQSLAGSTTVAVGTSGFIIALACNLANNLPVGLIAGSAVQTGHLPELIKSALLIGVDLGPNLSITGSLATILWLVALRREGIIVKAWTFLKLGLLIMTVALAFTLAALWL